MNNDNVVKLAKQKIIDHSDCEECLEDYIFAMKDSHHEFALPLTTVLACLAFAEEEGAVPKLPDDWWISIANRY